MIAKKIEHIIHKIWDKKEKKKSSNADKEKTNKTSKNMIAKLK